MAAFLLGEDKVFIVSFACNPKISLGVFHLRINYSIDIFQKDIHQNLFFVLLRNSSDR